jgi:hypothetical protein
MVQQSRSPGLGLGRWVNESCASYYLIWNCVTSAVDRGS